MTREARWEFQSLDPQTGTCMTSWLQSSSLSCPKVLASAETVVLGLLPWEIEILSYFIYFNLLKVN